jgi:HD superfamily phosphodiesterase
MNLNGQIESAENHFKQILEDFFVSVFMEKSLSSHGIEHHRRVWVYSKELLPLIFEHHHLSNPHFIEELIVAAYLHDIGMSVETGPRHGRHSVELCKRFLKKYGLKTEDFSTALEAIENHDLKDYNSASQSSDLLTILSVADDLDAFGFIGIFRFAEIYLTRKINIEDIGSLIMENAALRFNHFLRIIGYHDLLEEKYKKKYLILDDFFKEYNISVLNYAFGTGHPTGYCGVIEIINVLIMKKTDIREFLENAEQDKYDQVIQWYFDSLGKELLG